MMVETSPRGLLTVVFRRWRRFAAVFLTVVGGACAYVALAEPGYQSQAQLMMNFAREVRPTIAPQPGQEAGAPERRQIIASTVKFLQNRDLAAALINEVGLARLYPAIANSPPSHGTPLDAAVTRLAKDLVVKADPESTVIDIGLVNADPEVAAAGLHSLLDLFVRRQAEAFGNPQAGFLHEQREEALRKVQESRQSLASYQASARIASADEEMRLLLQRRSDAEESLTEARGKAADADARRATLGKSLHATPRETTVAIDGERFRPTDEAERKLNDLREHKALLLQTYEPTSPMVVSLNQQIATQEDEVAALHADMEQRQRPNPNGLYQSIEADSTRATADGEAAKAQMVVLTSQLDEIAQQIKGLQDRTARFQELTHQLQADEETLKAYDAREEEAKLAASLNDQGISRISVIEQPSKPLVPSHPKSALILFLSVLAGLVGGLLAMLVSEALDTTLALPEQVGEALGLPVLASFPRHKFAGQGKP